MLDRLQMRIGFVLKAIWRSNGAPNRSRRKSRWAMRQSIGKSMLIKRWAAIF